MAQRKTQVQSFMKMQLEQAQKRLSAFEQDAEQVMKSLMARGRAQRKELEKLIGGLNKGELLDAVQVKRWGKKANQASTEVRKRLDQLQTRVVKATGVASQEQVQQINRELNKLSKKIDALLKTPARPETRA